MPYRLVFVIQKLAGLSGGAERVLIETARGLSQRPDMEVSLLSYEANQAPPAYPLDNLPHDNLFPGAALFARKTAPVETDGYAAGQGYRRPRRVEALVRSLPNAGWLGSLKWALTHGMFARRLRATFRKTQPDVVIAFLPPAIAAVGWALRSIDGAQRPEFVASTHNLPEADFGDSSPRWDQNPVYRQRARAALRSAQVITVLSTAFETEMIRLLKSDPTPHGQPSRVPRIAVLPNPVRRLAPPPSLDPQRELIILGVGRLTTVKSFDRLIDAFAQVAPAFPNWRVVILGEGEERARLEARVVALGLQDKVTLPGATSDIAQYYDTASLLCHPARFEGFGLAVAEAMAHGMPVVAFADCPGVNALIEHDRTGVLVPSEGDPVSALALALAQMMGDPSRRATFGQRAQDITTRFDAREISEAWAKLITQAIQASPEHNNPTQ